MWSRKGLEMMYWGLSVLVAGVLHVGKWKESRFFVFLNEELATFSS